jgi:hypothetical protein
MKLSKPMTRFRAEIALAVDANTGGVDFHVVIPDHKLVWIFIRAALAIFALRWSLLASSSQRTCDFAIAEA